MSSEWCTIESDPAVFTELIEKVGVKGVSVEELITLDAAELEKYQNVYGLIFLFKWKPTAEVASTGTVVKDAPVYFAKQTIHDACATLAIVNTLCNHAGKIQLGDSMRSFLEFTQDLDPELRGSSISNFEPLRLAHNSFAVPEVFPEEGHSPKHGDAYHFVSFVYRAGSIWQLDGLQDGPILCADATDATYRTRMVESVQWAITEVVATDTSGAGQGISFALMAIVDDPIQQLEAKIAALRAEEKSVSELEEELYEKKAERERGHRENIRRRHNYIPAIVELLKCLAEKGHLTEIVDEAKKKRKP